MTSDEALYERLLGGEMHAFDLLYARYERPLFGFVRSYLANNTEAEEVIHEAFLAVLQQRGKGRSVTSFRAWLYRVARNQCLNRRRKMLREQRAMAVVASEPDQSDMGPESQLLASETACSLRRAVAQLPPQLGELYALRSKGMPYEELAEVLQIPIGTVKSRIHAMLRTLRQEMST